jgi:plasmid maintenance system antidote protein VapI
MMKTINFEAVKVALKQDKEGYVLTLRIHPDDLQDELMRDFIGSRYQVVMVRLNENEEPMNREADLGGAKAVRIAGMLCRDPKFWDYLHQDVQIIEASEKEATEWLRNYLNVQSRSDIKTNTDAQKLLDKLNKEFKEWSSVN